MIKNAKMLYPGDMFYLTIKSGLKGTNAIYDQSAFW